MSPSRGASLSDAERAWPPAHAGLGCGIPAGLRELARVRRSHRADAARRAHQGRSATYPTRSSVCSPDSASRCSTSPSACRWRASRIAVTAATSSPMAVLVWSAMTAACGLAWNYISLLAARAGTGAGEGALSPGRAIDARRLLSQGTSAGGARAVLDGHLYRQWRWHSCSVAR